MGRERKSEGSVAGANPEDQDAVDCRQDNKLLSSVRFVIAQQLVYHAFAVRANCCAEQSHKDNVRSSAVGKQLMKRKSNFEAQLHLPALDLFWVNLRVQLHLPPVDPAWTLTPRIILKIVYNL